MRYDLRESDETNGHAWLKSTKFVFFRRFWSEGRVDIALGRMTYFEAFFFAPPRPSPLPVQSQPRSQGYHATASKSLPF